MRPGAGDIKTYVVVRLTNVMLIVMGLGFMGGAVAMRADGSLSEAEFAAIKAKLLGGS